jgi:hypothetical protein
MSDPNSSPDIPSDAVVAAHGAFSRPGLATPHRQDTDRAERGELAPPIPAGYYQIVEEAEAFARPFNGDARFSASGWPIHRQRLRLVDSMLAASEDPAAGDILARVDRLLGPPRGRTDTERLNWLIEFAKSHGGWATDRQAIDRGMEGTK